ncbi:urease accessory protein UreF [Synechococcus sp. CS-1325]|uniref:urease accessory protein UreF n=1 Tax=unclassified Synechococcus TaxID=2626047 RepID=UPI000DB35887|nr:MULTISPECIES: urease accessory UreF family protein [unclassified Synechococcus]PZV02343.1 MAG: urease accessory protein UreF [Cyanobium sp.]MCT0198913.1 urease accessory protein UreF [Synechococcus sp. CS-1325]MCT0214562.1 urease accessory protein UreF [Synechococcus sp. CS-1326]MCT0230886.1 urease accessory protein UreF [Synechococcus sp. CS-1324]MCT0233896.1 urease accessory protein UreF [Synechococcus sp. CS-1327]
MTTDSRPHLWQLLSPALPVGAFSYSEGLEELVQGGRLGNAEALRRWLEAELWRGAITIEAASLKPLQSALTSWRDAEDRNDQLAAAAAASDLLDRDGWLRVLREAPELRAQQCQMGHSLLQLLGELGWPLPGNGHAIRPARLGWPAAWAWAGLCLELELEELVEAYLYGWVANQVSAAVRLIPLGPTQGQRLQLAMASLLGERAIALVNADPHQLWNGGVGAGMAQLRHAELYSRLFRS